MVKEKSINFLKEIQDFTLDKVKKLVKIFLMVKPLSLDQMIAQVPEAVRRSFAKPKDQKLSPEQIARLEKRTPLQAAMAKLPSSGNSGTE